MAKRPEMAGKTVVVLQASSAIRYTSMYTLHFTALNCTALHGTMA